MQGDTGTHGPKWCLRPTSRRHVVWRKVEARHVRLSTAGALCPPHRKMFRQSLYTSSY